MIVYRVEHKDGKHGPFSTMLINVFYMNSTDHPPPEDDCIPFRIGCGAIFGCPDWQSLRHWFYNSASRRTCRDNIVKLNENDYIIRVYNAPDDEVMIGVSNRQLAFYRERAELCGVIAVRNLMIDEFEPNF